MSINPLTENQDGRAPQGAAQDFAAARDDVRTFAEDAGAPDDASRRVQDFQDEQAAEANPADPVRRFRKAAQDAVAGTRQLLDDSFAGVIIHGAGRDVIFSRDEIDIRYDKRSGIARAQMERAIEVAVRKGWTTMYLYDKYGNPDIMLAAQFNNVIREMGLEGKIGCCVDGTKTCPLGEMKKRLGQQLPVMAAAAGVGAGIGALAVSLLRTQQAPEP